MMSAKMLRHSTAAFALFAGAMLAGGAEAQQMAAAASTTVAAASATNVETVVVTGTAFNPETAPAKTLEAFWPLSIGWYAHRQGVSTSNRLRW